MVEIMRRPLLQGLTKSWVPASKLLLVLLGQMGFALIGLGQAVASTCPYEDDLLLWGMRVASTVRYQACQTLTAGPALTVDAGANLTLRAGQKLTLKPGFQVARGATLKETPIYSNLTDCM